MDMNKKNLGLVVITAAFSFVLYNALSFSDFSGKSVDISGIKSTNSVEKNRIKDITKVAGSVKEGVRPQIEASLLVESVDGEKPLNEKEALEITMEAFKKKEALHQKAYGDFRKIKNFEQAYDNDIYDPEWASKMIDGVNNSILYPNGEAKFSAIEIDEFDCKKRLCKIDFRRNTGNEQDWDSQRTDLLYALLNFGGSGDASANDFDRAVKTEFLEDNKIRYYISRGVSDLTE
jgi:hypothetical protein